jgi:hypothetical protein
MIFLRMMGMKVAPPIARTGREECSSPIQKARKFCGEGERLRRKRTAETGESFSTPPRLRAKKSAVLPLHRPGTASPVEDETPVGPRVRTN